MDRAAKRVGHSEAHIVDHNDQHVRRSVRRLDLESWRRCDRLIADAEGDAPLPTFWRGVKCEFETESSARDGSS